MPHSQAPVAAGLQAIHANHLEDLRRVVVWLIREYPIAPLDDETFLVQSNGIAQWLKLALAEHPRDEQGATHGGIGIAAAMAFSLPSRFVWQAYRAVLGPDQVPPESPYDKDRLTWRLYGLLPGLRQDPQYAPLARFLEGAESDRRRYQLAEKIADLYDQYQVFRADWLSAWEDGHDHLMPARGEPLSLGEEQRWQPALWRRLVAGMTAAERPGSRSRIHTQFMAAARQLTPAQRPAGLPRRIIVFGVSSLPQQTLEVLDALGHCCQVVLCVHNPCRYYWADIVSDRDLLRAERKRGAVRANLHTPPDPDQLHLHAQPLLAAWGKQGRDYIRLLDQFDNPDHYRGGFATAGQRVDIFEPPQGGQLLQQIQTDITELRPLHETRDCWPPLDAQQDRSVVFHSAHSPQREVEILHDQLLAAFNADATLRPRDTIVMVPDINLYAPHIQAVFGRYRPEHRCHIPFTISDQGQRHQVPLLVALEQLLGLPDSRFGVSEILSLLAVPALRQRFGIAETDLPRLHQWIDQANIRWGLDAQHRQDLDLPAGLERNTWLFGLQRMLAGFALGDGAAWQGIEPYAEVGGLEAAMAGQLDRFLQRLAQLRTLLMTPARAEDWLQRIDHLRNTFFAELDEADLIAWNRFQGAVETWFAATRDAAIDDELLPLAIVREVWLEGLDQGGLNQRFLAGSVNFATLMPMRAIPFRRVCLLGMNDGDYPRARPPLDFDLMARDYRPGDRSRREDDRYLFLEALLSAREQLYISWVGRSVRDNALRPPSVLVGQLRDHINSGWTLQAGASQQTPAGALTTQHPLQPFSSAYFPPRNGHGLTATDALASGRLFTYDREWRASLNPATGVADAPLAAWLPPEPLTLAQLSRFLRKPVASFYQERLQVYFEELDQVTDDAEPFALNGLVRWQLQDELIRQAVLKAGDSGDLMQQLTALTQRMARRGDLGMGLTESALAERITEPMQDMHGRYRELLAHWSQPVEEPLAFHYQWQSDLGPLVVEAQLDRVVSNGNGDKARLIVSSTELLQGGKKTQYNFHNLLTGWLEHLAATIAAGAVTTVFIGKRGSITLPPMDSHSARACLDDILQGWYQGMAGPLPVTPRAAFAWLDAWHGKNGSDAKAQQKARESWQSDLERDPGYLSRCWPEAAQAVADPGFQHWLQRLYAPLWQHIKGQEESP